MWVRVSRSFKLAFGISTRGGREEHQRDPGSLVRVPRAHLL